MTNKTYCRKSERPCFQVILLTDVNGTSESIVTSVATPGSSNIGAVISP